MYTAVTVLIILTSVLLVLVVLVQNPKGDGISSGIIGSNQV
ncbi:MAG: preprotein translocase subunit SecG, partial [Bacteroidota bacterium]